MHFFGDVLNGILQVTKDHVDVSELLQQTCYVSSIAEKQEVTK